jgi:hypothetical protein
MIFFIVLNGCSAHTGISIEPIPETGHTLKIVTPQAQSVRAIYKIAGEFSRNNPAITTEVSVISGILPINTFLPSKFAVGDVPDILIYSTRRGAVSIFLHKEATCWISPIADLKAAFSRNPKRSAVTEAASMPCPWILPYQGFLFK